MVKYLAFFFETAAAAAQSIDVQNVADACGNQSMAKALDATHYISASICELSGLMEDIHAYLECANWYPLYEEGVYVAMCDEATSGFGWVTATQIAIVVCSTVILSFRVVFHEIDVDVAPSAKEIMEDGAVGTVVPDDKDASNDKEQAMAAVIVDGDDQLESKDDTQVLESAFVSDKLDDDETEDKTWPVDDSETHEVDTGDGALMSDPTDLDQDRRVFLEDEKVLAADENGTDSHEVNEAWDDSEAVEQDLGEDSSESAKNTHGEKDYASWIADNVETYPVDKDNAVVPPDLLTTKEHKKVIAADEIWLRQTQGMPQATNNASSDEEEI